MKRWSPLNERQLLLLRRICAGDEPVSSAEPGLASTVYALRNRRLVTTTRTGRGWTAAATDAGHFYLREGKHPEHPSLRRGSDTDGGPGRAEPLPKTEPDDSDCAAFIDALHVGDGELHRPAATTAERRLLRRTARRAEKLSLIPDGLRITIVDTSTGVLFHLSRIPARPDSQLSQLPGSALHLVARSAELAVCEQCTGRARRILHELCVQAERREFTVIPVEPGGRGAVVAEARGTRFLIHMRESKKHVPDARTGKYDWQRITATTEVETHLLHFDVPGIGNGRSWGDRKAGTIDQKIPELLTEMER